MANTVFELQGSIGLDTSGFTQALNNCMNAVNQTENTLNSINHVLSSTNASMSLASGSVDSVGDAAEHAAGGTSQLESALDNAQQAVQAVQTNVNNLAEAYEQSAQSTGEASDQTQQLAQDLQAAQTALQNAQTAEQNAANTLGQYSQNADDAQESTQHLSTNTQQAGNQAEHAEGKFKKLADSLKGVAEKAWKAVDSIAKISAGVATAAGGAIVGLTKKSLDAAASYEQLKGGVETLFGIGGMEIEQYAESVGKSVEDVKEEFNGYMSAQNKVLENASKAFATAGMSANEYIETVTGFSASLIQATGRGEQQDIDALRETLDEEYEMTKQSLADQLDEAKEAWQKRIKLAEDSAEKEALREQMNAEIKDLKRANEQQLKLLKSRNDQRVADAEAANSKSEKSAESIMKAAELSDMAVRDMSDNANKMGTAIGSIQNAYQGFAKQNYTMLDNLKLGYGGTKEEMERLLDDAERLSGVEYDISSLADVYNAIHVIQQEMGISGMSAEEVAEAIASGAMTEEEAYAKMGTTAKEAAHTIEGSVGSMKAAWENLVTAFGVSEMPIDTYVTNFVDSISTAAENVVPRIGLIVKNIGEKLPGTLSRLFENLKKSIEKNDLGTALLDGIDALVTNASTEIQKMFNSLFYGNTLSGLLTRATGTVGTITEALSNMFRTIMGRLPEIVSGAADILRNMGGTIWGTLMDTITTLTEGDSLTQIVDSVGGLIEDAVSRLAQDLPTIVSSLATLVTKLVPQVVTSLVDNIEPIIHGVGTILTSIIDSLTHDDGILDNLVTGISAIVDSIVDNIDPILLALDSVINTVLEKLLEPETMGKIMNSAADILARVIVGAAKVLGSFTGFSLEFSENLGETIGNAINQGVIEESLAGIGAGIIQALGIEDEFELGVEMIEGYIDEVKEYWEAGWQSLEDFGAGVFDWFANIGEAIINFADSIAQGVENITSGFTDNPVLNGIKGFGDKVGNWLGFNSEEKQTSNGINSFGNTIGSWFGFDNKEKQISNGFSNRSIGASPDSGRNVTINFTQNNTSPQELDEYEIWRQSQRATDLMRLQLQGG